MIGAASLFNSKKQRPGFLSYTDDTIGGTPANPLRNFFFNNKSFKKDDTQVSNINRRSQKIK